ncbi:prion-like-(Q/N-rich) domain-bearing protein 25 [Melitaea cinxia]|uniref:prion-like-(Q/N-rich) domain-bearing protein 25 n=1 Tax=Melitaea cinxia TaxID=113334 RepID=UPI001E2740DC|nr:prion-like-(Q/N-rich) domain-bearing protein 25 [Melitaea cinxia]
MGKAVLFVFAIVFSVAGVRSQWACATDGDCSSVSGSICASGACACRPGQQVVLRGSACVDISPYIESPCVEDHQCQRLFTGFECRKSGNDTGACFCQDGYHYFLGRCWRSIDFGEVCSRSEECFGVIRDPHALTCQGTCQCSEGYYLRQRGECRKFSSAPGGGCVLDSDCRFPNGTCDLQTFTCAEGPLVSTVANSKTDLKYKMANDVNKMADSVNKMADTVNKMAVQRVACNASTPCSSPFQCSNFGVCICPTGYYESEDGSMCYAELGSPSTLQQCVGLLAVVIDGVCSCPDNFFYDENMKDCIRVTRRLAESCVSDWNCHTFGAAAVCGPPGPWGLRACRCDLDVSVWDGGRQLCRYFAGVGESCEVDSDCLAGSLEIRCVINDQGNGFCACPDNLLEVDGLCLTTGLELGDPCQHPLECSVENSICTGVCSCADGYRPLNGICSPIIGGSCNQDSDCLVENTVCRNSTSGLSCSCDTGFVEFEDECLPEALGFNSTCVRSAQCVPALGQRAVCSGERCACSEDAHYRDEACWPLTRLFEACSTSSQCFLESDPGRVVCRNSLCQCDFHHPYSFEEGTCLSSKATVYSASALLLLTLLSVVFR